MESPAQDPADEEPILPAGLDLPEAPTLERARSVTPATVPEVPTYEVDPMGELALIRQGQDALQRSPSRALALMVEHARRFGSGTLAQEREVLAIDALAALGRLEAAHVRAEAFRRAWPHSAHLRRIDVILTR